tara:strand:+ start:64 stop:345 length:282 start_codon:yes stop_codon:yes gene_type:complete
LEILIKKNDNNTFAVSIESSINSNHIVTLNDDIHNEMTKGFKSKEELILFSFKFLLERENNTSILSNFNLEIIQNYFPQYKNEIQNWINHEKD